MKKICVCLVICAFCIFMAGCEVEKRKPITVTFIDVSGALSTDHTIKIAFAEEKDYENYFIDILVKSDTDLKLVLFQEFSSKDDRVEVDLKANGEYVSLAKYKLFNLEEEQTESMVGYKDALTTNLVVNSSKDANLTFLAVVGENKDGEFKQVGKVSKEYSLAVLKHIEKSKQL